MLIPIILLSGMIAFADGGAVLKTNVKNGTVNYGGYIYIYSDTDSVRVYYTADGTEPDDKSNVYTGNGILMQGRKIRLKAVGYCSRKSGRSCVCEKPPFSRYLFAVRNGKIRLGDYKYQ